MNNKVRLHFSSYMYARLAAMKGQLFRKADYDRLLKMGYNESLRFLEDSAYGEDIKKYYDAVVGIQSIERALNSHLLTTIKKVHRISDDSYGQFLSTYLLRYDLENIKLVLRSKLTNYDISNLLFPCVNFKNDFIEDLQKKSNIFEVAECLSFFKGRTFKNLNEIEEALDRYYIKELYQFAQRVRGEEGLIKNFILQELEAHNIKLLLREENADLMYPTELILKLQKIKGLDKKIGLLRKEKIVSVVPNDEDLMLKIEIDLDVNLIKKQSKLLHKYPLSSLWIIGFLFAKEIEVRNLKMILKAKKFELGEKYLDKLLVVAR